MLWRSLTVADSPDSAPGSGALWIGALSFEERCTGSLKRLVDGGNAPGAAMLIDYETAVHPAAEDRERRRRNLRTFEAICGRAPNPVGLERTTVEPYSYRSVQRAVRMKIDALRPSRVILDISCLTRIHVIALAHPGLLVACPRWELAHTRPETYGHLQTSRDAGGGWKDVLVLPVGDPREIVNESAARGLVLSGHEGDRLVIALSELEPTCGVIVTAQTDGRPDLRARAVQRNLPMTQLLVSRGPQRWRTETVSLKTFRVLEEIVAYEVEQARLANAPIFLYPFGPKPFVALAAMQLAACEGLAAWFVYPIPNSYDVDYSYGTGPTHWFRDSSGPSGEQDVLPIGPDD